VIGHTSRRIRILGATTHPTTTWVAQAAKNLVMDLEDAGCRTRYMIRDRDGKLPALFDTILNDTGIEVVYSGVRMPRTNSIMERWIQTCRRELLDRTLIWNQRHLSHALRVFEEHYNSHRPHDLRHLAFAREIPLLRELRRPAALRDPGGSFLQAARVSSRRARWRVGQAQQHDRPSCRGEFTGRTRGSFRAVTPETPHTLWTGSDQGG
jgi:Integrase core domain